MGDWCVMANDPGVPLLVVDCDEASVTVAWCNDYAEYPVREVQLMRQEVAYLPTIRRVRF